MTITQIMTHYFFQFNNYAFFLPGCDQNGVIKIFHNTQYHHNI